MVGKTMIVDEPALAPSLEVDHSSKALLMLKVMSVDMWMNFLE